MARGILGVVAQPLNLLPVGEVGELTQRVARATGMMDRGLVDASPLGLEGASFGSMRAASTAADAASESLDVFLRGHDGTNYLANTGTGEVVNLDTGEAVDLSQPENVKQFAGRSIQEIAENSPRTIARMPHLRDRARDRPCASNRTPLPPPTPN